MTAHFAGNQRSLQSNSLENHRTVTKLYACLLDFNRNFRIVYCLFKVQYFASEIGSGRDDLTEPCQCRANAAVSTVLTSVPSTDGRPVPHTTQFRAVFSQSLSSTTPFVLAPYYVDSSGCGVPSEAYQLINCDVINQTRNNTFLWTLVKVVSSTLLNLNY
jgi:hypothetical protein